MPISTNDAIFLGNFGDADTTEGTGSRTLENTAVYQQTFGSAGSPLYDNVVDVNLDDADGDGVIYTDNFGGAEDISHDLGAGTVVTKIDSVASVDVTVTYYDGSTAALTDVVMYQDQLGNLFVQNSTGASDGLNGPNNLPVVSIEVTAVQNVGWAGIGNFGGIDDITAPVAGDETGENMGVGYVDAAGDQITESADVIFAGGGNDTIAGGGGNDTIDGGAGDDTLVGGSGDDSLLGGDGNDFFDASTSPDGEDTLLGGAGNDTIQHDLNDDIVDGGDGDDYIVNVDVTASSGITTITGGDGTDTYALDASEGGGFTSGQVVNLSIGYVTFNGALRDVLSSIENVEIIGAASGVIGDAANNVITATGDFDNVLEGGDGADTIDGGAGADTLHGDQGNDSIDGGLGNDSILGGLGGDTISGGDGDDYIDGGDGDDLLRSGAGQDTLVGGDGNDTLLNSVGNDSLVGGTGDDSIVATWGNDTLEGGTGNDTLIGGADDDSVEGGAGEDVIYSGTRNIPGTYTEQTGTSDSFTGTNGNDDFTGTTTSSDGQVSSITSNGLSGYWLGNGDGVETHTHTFSQDVAGARIDFNALNSGEYLSFEIDGFTVDLNTLIANGDAVFDGANAYGIDGSGRIIETGPDGNATIGSITFLRPFTEIDVISSVDTTGSGLVYEMHVDTNPPTYSDDDFLSGGDDADTFIIEDAFGTDTIVGGEGGNDDDVIDMSGLSGPVTVTYSGNEAGTITDGTDTITFSEIERLNLTDQADVVSGGSDSVGLDVDGGGGDDSLGGGLGDDTLLGGAGNDTLAGGYGGNDILSGGDGDDVLIEGNFNTTMEGGAGSDRFEVGYGNSSVSGGDTGSNVDTLSAVVSNDAISVAFDGTGFGTYDDLTDGDSGTFSGIEAVEGSSGADSIDGSLDSGGLQLSGNGGDDTITGGSGDDTLTGGTDDDMITGGGGDDVFAFNVGDGADTIADFNTGNTGALGDGDTTNNDFIDLSQYYTDLNELRADFDDDGVLNQSAAPGTDYSDNTALDGGDAITFTGVDRNSFTADNTGVVCFAAGTLILTDKGEVPVERLRVEDKIVTYDNGVQPLAMVASRRLGAQDLSRNPELKPIEFKAGALGSEHPLIVSPQHMMLVAHEGSEAFVRARQLSRLHGGAVRVMQGCRQVTYFLLIFDAHQIVFANKRPAESFFPGPRAIAALDADARQEFTKLFPDMLLGCSGATQPQGWHSARTGIRTRLLPPKVELLRSPKFQFAQPT